MEERHLGYSALRLLALSVTLTVSSLAHAQVYNCDGKWTNVPCDGKTPSIDTTVRAKRVLSPSQAAERGRKQTVLHDLTMKAIEAKREFDIRVDIVPADKVCSDPTSTLAECEKLTTELDDRLTRMITDARLIRAQEDAAREQARLRELQMESNRIQQERNEIEARKRNRSVVIIQNNQNIGNDAIRNSGSAHGGRRPVVIRQRQTVITSPNGTVIRDTQTVPVPLQTPWGGVQIPTNRNGISVGIQLEQ